MISFKDNHMSMFIILPKRYNAMEDLEQGLRSHRIFDTLDSRMKALRVSVAIPKFRLEESLDMKKVLQKLAVTDAFAHRANFSRISDESNLYLSAAFHKAFIDVSEEGTEAAAATGTIP